MMLYLYSFNKTHFLQCSHWPEMFRHVLDMIQAYSVLNWNRRLNVDEFQVGHIDEAWPPPSIYSEIPFGKHPDEACAQPV